MKNYTYLARNVMGQVVEGTIQANDSNEAYEQVTKDKLIPIKIRPAADSKDSLVARLFVKRVRVEEIIVFTRQLSTMLKAGIPIVQTLEILRDQTESPEFKRILIGVGDKLDSGSRLSEGLAEFPRIFTPEYVSIVVSGETGGDLVKALINIAQWMERETEIRSAIKTALRYPIMVSIAMLIAVIIMVIFVIPKFAAFFTQSTVALPLPTRILLGGNDLFQHSWPIILVAAVGMGVGGVFLMKVKTVRWNVDKMKFHLRIIGPIYTKIMVARFGRIFAMLVRNGVTVLQAMDIAPTVVANTYFQQLLINVRQAILDGHTIADSFLNEMPVFPAMVTSLIAVGEKTGSLDEMLDQVVDFYDMEINYALKNLTMMIEPIITLLIGGGVLFLALAVLLPIWNMSQVLTSKAQ